MILSLILAVSTPIKPQNVEYTPRYSYYYSISKGKDLSKAIKSKTNQASKIENTVVISEPDSFLIDTDNKLSKDEIVGLIRDYSIKYNVDPERSIRIAKCESGFNPLAVNATGHIGLFQFNLRTFKANAKRLGLENANALNPYHNIEVATYMFSLDQHRQWSCK